jgi:hypothetical protein
MWWRQYRTRESILGGFPEAGNCCRGDAFFVARHQELAEDSLFRAEQGISSGKHGIDQGRRPQFSTSELLDRRNDELLGVKITPEGKHHLAAQDRLDRWQR